jgi:superfamily II DNA or RNA helicase/HKD family nuclease
MSDSSDYYTRNAPQYFMDTAHVDMTAFYEEFLSTIPQGGLLMDAGCGSGRDTKEFLSRGYRVVAFDASPEIANLAAQHTNHPVSVRTLLEVNEEASYDGIWACASLLHVPETALSDAFFRLWRSLKPDGVMYVSFKLGNGERNDGNRHFTDATEPRLRSWLHGLAEVDSIHCWTTDDQRPGRSEQWLNALVRRQPAEHSRVVAGGSNHFLPHLCAAIAQADEIDFAVAFIKVTGLRLLLPDLLSALDADGTRSRPPARFRVVTSDYLDVTDPEALRLLMLLQAHGADVRVFEAAGSSFHMKAYLFAHFQSDPSGGPRLTGTAFIGSSNISRQALKDGLEWNYRVDYPTDSGYLEARARFEELFTVPQTVPLTDRWIDEYEARRVAPLRAIAPGTQEVDPPPIPTSIQLNALAALSASRQEGYRRGLVVLATGLGKTWLAAFDAQQQGARRVLFVAHREEILEQAAETFLRIRPRARVGFYMGETRDSEVDVLCASVQTLSRSYHLERFQKQHFDYVVIDEFHHAAAATYRRLLSHFAPQFLLGLTATPDRSDQSDILSLCDDNLVYVCNLFAGIESGLLAPFHYYGIFDESVNYKELPWRNGRFDPAELSNKLATLARARHAHQQWLEKRLTRTLAFCVSIRHAEYMAAYFSQAGISSAAVYAGSELSRGDALERLADRRLEVLFSVDLFNEGVDLPSIDTVMLLRPTESKILFLQQLGRGLRKTDEKSHLVVLDFIGNHQSFLHKPQALLGAGQSFKQIAEFARRYEQQRLELPTGCFVNFDLRLIEFLKSLDTDGITKDYEALKTTLGRRPSLAEFYRAGVSITTMRRQFGSWFELVNSQGDLSAEESDSLAPHKDFLREVETTTMTKSFKMVLLEAFQELGGWSSSPSFSELAEHSWEVLQRRRPLLSDLPDNMRGAENSTPAGWLGYWKSNPINAWTGGNLADNTRAYFQADNDHLQPTFIVPEQQRDTLAALVQELVDYRLAAYEVRKSSSEPANNVLLFKRPTPDRTTLAYFPNLKIACGHFKTGTADSEEHRSLGAGHGRLDPARHFIARASGNSMDGGKNPIRDGDYLLLELITPSSAGSITGKTIVIERQDQAGDNQYLLRVVRKAPDGTYALIANNPDYEDLLATDEMRTRARLMDILDPMELAIGNSFKRDEIPALFGEQFNPAVWETGHVVIKRSNSHVLLVTLNKQGSATEHRYIDHWIDEKTFHWQSQRKTKPESSRGKAIIEQARLGTRIHLFVRENKLEAGKAAPFIYFGQLRYENHSGSAPISVVFKVES